MNDEYTHVGWFYWVPIICTNPHKDMVPRVEMRWTGWTWPIHLCAITHNILNYFFMDDKMLVLNVREKDKPHDPTKHR